MSSIRGFVTTVAFAVVFALLVSQQAVAAGGTISYSAIPLTGTLPGNVPSLGFEATSTSEFGDYVRLASVGAVTTMRVVMSSWACEQGNWTTGCVTRPGSRFTLPITANLYTVNTATTPPSKGTLIASKTQSFDIRYRPSSTPALCGGDAQVWYDAHDKTCYHGLAQSITFNFDGEAELTSPNLIWTVAYDTTHYGSNPVGQAAPCFATAAGCGYDSLNVGSYSFAPNAFVGTDVEADGAFLNSTSGATYCDLGTGGIGSLRDDVGNTNSCWTGYRPLAQISTK